MGFIITLPAGSIRWMSWCRLRTKQPPRHDVAISNVFSLCGTSRRIFLCGCVCLRGIPPPEVLVSLPTKLPLAAPIFLHEVTSTLPPTPIPTIALFLASYHAGVTEASASACSSEVLNFLVYRECHAGQWQYFQQVGNAFNALLRLKILSP